MTKKKSAKVTTEPLRGTRKKVLLLKSVKAGPFDYEKGKIADKVFEDLIGDEEEEEEYGEQEADDSRSLSASPVVRES